MASAAPAPPLPPLDTTGSGASDQAAVSPMAQMIAGITPVKSAADQILMACKQIVMSGAVPGSEQICGQIISLATQLVPMALQQQMGGQAMGMGGGQPSSPAPMAPPQGPQPVTGPQGF
jgi:hypothetical protein